MRAICIVILLFLFMIICVPNSFAQVNVSLSEVAKIHIADGAWYLGGSYRNEYELVNESGKWKSYQIRESYYRNNLKARSRAEIFEKRDSVEHRFIKIVPQDSITLFLNVIRTVKPKFNAADLKISIPEITKRVDTGSLKHLNKQDTKIFNSFFNTRAKLNHLLDTVQYDGWTDDAPLSAIEIIKKSGDTIKIVSRRQVSYMLPWVINKVPTYDLRINQFFITATNLINHRMSGKGISYQIFSMVDYLYAQQAFELLRWQDTSPENVKYLRRHFDIVKVRRFNDNSSYSFHPKMLNAHILVNGILNIKDKDQLRALTRYAEDTVKAFIKIGGFMIDSCLQKRGCVINFGNSLGGSSHSYFAMQNRGLEQYLKKFNPQDLRPFSIIAGARIEDDWVKLPDGNFVLTAYVDDYAVGVLPQYIKKDGYQRRKFVFMIFSPNGKLISSNNN
jgi:hypothetical protein